MPVVSRHRSGRLSPWLKGVRTHLDTQMAIEFRDAVWFIRVSRTWHSIGLSDHGCTFPGRDRRRDGQCSRGGVGLAPDAEHRGVAARRRSGQRSARSQGADAVRMLGRILAILLCGGACAGKTPATAPDPPIPEPMPTFGTVIWQDDFRATRVPPISWRHIATSTARARSPSTRRAATADSQAMRIELAPADEHSYELRGLYRRRPPDRARLHPDNRDIRPVLRTLSGGLPVRLERGAGCRNRGQLHGQCQEAVPLALRVRCATAVGLGEPPHRPLYGEPVEPHGRSARNSERRRRNLRRKIWATGIGTASRSMPR